MKEDIKMIEINDSQFNALVLKSSLPVLIECASPECIICKTMAERVLEAAKDYASQMLFFRLNINANKKWHDFGVRVIPTLLYFKNGALAAKQENFPHLDDIHKEIRAVIKGKASASNAGAELKAILDLEAVAARFHKHICVSAKNGQVKEKFRLIHEESLAHREILETKFKELTGEAYELSSEIASDAQASPQGFSLAGALKMAVKIEEKLLKLYTKIGRKKFFDDKECLKKLIKEKTGHYQVMRKEMKFSQNNELLSPIESPGYPSWLNKVFE